MNGEPLIGQCRCGGTLTVDHLRYHCPLMKREREFSYSELKELENIVARAMKRTKNEAVTEG